jgi:hypothetical protein
MKYRPLTGHLITPANKAEIGIWDAWHAYRSLYSKIKDGTVPIGNYLGSLLPAEIAVVIQDLPIDRDGGIQILTSAGKMGWINGNHVVRIK